jgi:hypothetical protein
LTRTRIIENALVVVDTGHSRKAARTIADHLTAGIIAIEVAAIGVIAADGRTSPAASVAIAITAASAHVTVAVTVAVAVAVTVAVAIAVAITVAIAVAITTASKGRWGVVTRVAPCGECWCRGNAQQ